MQGIDTTLAIGECSGGMISLMKALQIHPARRVEKAPAKPATSDSAPAVNTGESAATLDAFAAIHRSKRFTAASAHQAFAGVKRKK